MHCLLEEPKRKHYTKDETSESIESLYNSRKSGLQIDKGEKGEWKGAFCDNLLQYFKALILKKRKRKEITSYRHFLLWIISVSFMMKQNRGFPESHC